MKIMIEAGVGVLVIPQGAGLAQLTLLPMFRSTDPLLKQGGNSGLGSAAPTSSQ